MKRVQIGKVVIDSGVIWIGDPCYIIGDSFPQNILGSNWNELCNKYLAKCEQNTGEIDGLRTANFDGIGIASGTGYGDGIYPVYAVIDSYGTIHSITIEFIESTGEDIYEIEDEDE